MNMSKTFQSSFLQRLRSFRSDNTGVAALEFALVIPIMIGLYIMLNETANGLRAARKVTMVARVMSDLATRPADISDTALSELFAAGPPILSPFGSASGSYRITSFRFDASGKGFVDWSEVRGGDLGAAYSRCTPTQSGGGPGPSPVSVPDGLKLPNTSVILAEALIKYKPVIGVTITGDIDLFDKLYMRPRTSAFVTRNGVTNALCPGYT